MMQVDLVATLLTPANEVYHLENHEVQLMKSLDLGIDFRWVSSPEALLKSSPHSNMANSLRSQYPGSFSSSFSVFGDLPFFVLAQYLIPIILLDFHFPLH